MASSFSGARQTLRIIAEQKSSASSRFPAGQRIVAISGVTPSSSARGRVARCPVHPSATSRWSTPTSGRPGLSGGWMLLQSRESVSQRASVLASTSRRIAGPGAPEASPARRIPSSGSKIGTPSAIVYVPAPLDETRPPSITLSTGSPDACLASPCAMTSFRSASSPRLITRSGVLSTGQHSISRKSRFINILDSLQDQTRVLSYELAEDRGAGVSRSRSPRARRGAPR